MELMSCLRIFVISDKLKLKKVIEWAECYIHITLFSIFVAYIWHYKQWQSLQKQIRLLRQANVGDFIGDIKNYRMRFVGDVKSPVIRCEGSSKTGLLKLIKTIK